MIESGELEWDGVSEVGFRREVLVGGFVRCCWNGGVIVFKDCGK